MTDHIPSKHIVRFYGHIASVLCGVRDKQKRDAKRAAQTDDRDISYAMAVFRWAMIRSICSLALTAIAPQRFGPTKERVAAAAQALEELDRRSELLANIVRNAETSSSKAFLAAVSDFANAPIAEGVIDG